MASETPPRGPLTGGVCCFCGTSVEFSDAASTSLSVRWKEAGEERWQQWWAHRQCLAELMHEQVSGEGPFFEG